MTVAVAARAYVNHGRWVAECPFCDVPEQVWPEGVRRVRKIPYAFGIAGGVLHCGWTGQTCPVEFPENLREIAQVLVRRPMRHRNWKPGESLEFLIAENATHGLV